MIKLKDIINEVKLQKGKTYGGTKCEGGCFVGKEGLKKIIKISKDSPKDVFMFRDDNYSGLQPHFVKDGVIAKATVLNPAYDLEKHKVRSLNIGKDVILSVRLFVSTNESIKELTHNEKSIRDGNPNNVYYAFYKGQFEAIYSAMGPSGLFDMYWDKFKVRRQAGSKFKLNPEFVLISKKDYDSSTSNRYAKLKPHVDKLWDTLKNESVNEGLYHVGYNKGRGQGTGVFKDSYSSYKDAKKAVEKLEKERGGSYNMVAYYVSDKDGKFVKESVTEAKSDYPVYHYTYTSAIQAAKAYAEKKGYEIDDDDSFRKIGMGPKKPSDGKTNRFSIELTKNGKPQKKMLHIQVYGMGTYKRAQDGSKTRSLYGGQNEYELNCYIN
jgi:hypothetical protein